MNKKFFIILILILILAAISWKFLSSSSSKVSFSTPKLENSPVPTAVPSDAPKSFKFNSSTDLKKELDSINPVVLESDFN